MRISDWSSDVCSSDLIESGVTGQGKAAPSSKPHHHKARLSLDRSAESSQGRPDTGGRRPARGPLPFFTPTAGAEPLRRIGRSDERRVGKEGVSTWSTRWETVH